MRTKTNLTNLVCLAVALLALTSMGVSTTTHAHHSFAMFDKGKVVTLKGVVRKVEWANPHVFLFVEVPAQDGPQQYAIECGSPNMLIRMGWKMNTINVGDAVTVLIHPLRDGRPGGAIDSVTLKDGLVIKAV